MASRVFWAPGQDTKNVACKRCGVPRRAGSNLAALCRDCTSTMNGYEKKVWS